MATNSGWYDPVCYQFYFCAISEQNSSQMLTETCRQFAEELTPYYTLWLSMEGCLRGQKWTENGCRMTTIFDGDGLEQYKLSLADQPFSRCELSPIPGKTLSRFATSARSIDKNWKAQTAHYTDLKRLTSTESSERKEWICHLMSCPTEDLRGIYFPKRCFMPGEVPLKISYECWESLAYMDEILQDSIKSGVAPEALSPRYLHGLRVSVPRYLLDAMDQAFLLQCVWKERLKQLCGKFENSIGTLKMDAFALTHAQPVLTGSGGFLPGFAKYLPDVAWAMCLTGHQLDTLGGMESLKRTNVFHTIEPLANGNVYLQLTSDISFTTKKEAAMLWRIVSPHLRSVPHHFFSVGEYPPSFRLGLKPRQLQMEESGTYQILL